MERLIGRLAVVALALCLGDAAKAAEQRTVTLADGTEMVFALAQPAEFNPDATYPALLVLPGGGQSIGGATRLVEGFWQAEAAKRGYVVFGPSAPWGRPFFGKFADDQLLPLFMNLMREQFHVEGGKFHLAGYSNGGESAFRVAVRHPEMFHSMTIMAGFAQDPADIAQLSKLKELPIAMFVGRDDEFVAADMGKTKDALEKAGVKVYFEIVPRSNHHLQGLRTPEGQAHLFDHVGKRQSCRRKRRGEVASPKVCFAGRVEIAFARTDQPHLLSSRQHGRQREL